MAGHSLLSLDFPPLQDGGIARWMDELARGLVAHGQDTRVLTRGRKPAALAHDAAYPAPVTRLPGHGWLAHHRRYLQLYRPWLGPRLEGRVLHAATYGVAAPLLGLLARRRVRLCVYVHGLELVEARGTPEARVLAEVLRAAHVIIANSGRVAELAVVAGGAPERVHVVAPAIDPARITPRGPDLRAAWGVAARPLILTLGRLVARKGQDVVLRALPAIRRVVPDVVYVIAGRGPDRSRLEALVDELGLAEAVVFAGFVGEADLGAAYRSADVYAMVARETDDDVEGFGITYLEANAAGVPVVGGRSGGVVDAVVHGETGLLVPPEDPEAVAAALIGLLTDPAGRRRLGAAGRARVEGPLGRAAMTERILGLLEI